MQTRKGSAINQSDKGQSDLLQFRGITTRPSYTSRERHLYSGIDYWQDRGEHEEDREAELGRDKEEREGGRLFF